MYIQTNQPLEVNQCKSEPNLLQEEIVVENQQTTDQLIELQSETQDNYDLPTISEIDLEKEKSPEPVSAVKSPEKSLVKKLMDKNQQKMQVSMDQSRLNGRSNMDNTSMLNMTNKSMANMQFKKQQISRIKEQFPTVDRRKSKNRHKESEVEESE